MVANGGQSFNLGFFIFTSSLNDHYASTIKYRLNMKEKKSMINLFVKAKYLSDNINIKEIIKKDDKLLIYVGFHRSDAEVTFEVFKSEPERKNSAYIKRVVCTCKSSVINTGKSEYVICPHEIAVYNWFTENIEYIKQKEGFK